MATKETSHKARAEAYAKKIIGMRGDDVLGTDEASLGLSFCWVELDGKPTEKDPVPTRLKNVIHVWEDVNGIVVKTHVGPLPKEQ